MYLSLKQRTEGLIYSDTQILQMPNIGDPLDITIHSRQHIFPFGESSVILTETNLFKFV